MHVHVLLKNNSMSEHVIYIYECVLQSVTYKPIKSQTPFSSKLNRKSILFFGRKQIDLCLQHPL
jgi:hypothetical protein